MPRTTSDAVKAVLAAGGDYNTFKSTDLSPYIETASAVVDDLVLLAAKFDGYVFLAAKLELIERWLAAWAYCMSDQPYSSKNTMSSGGSFQGQTGMRLEANKYGHTALLLDFTGNLDAMNKNSYATASWIGKPPSTQIPFDQRD